VSMPKNSLMWLSLSLIILILDQITKTWVSTHLSLNQPVNILPHFDLRLLHNTGAAWGFLADQGGWQRWFLSLLAIIVSIVIMVLLTRLDSKQRWLACTLALILGGALGNVMDRIIFGYVVDFIDISYQGWHWPAFNIADIGISIGAVMLLIDAIIFKHE